LEPFIQSDTFKVPRDPGRNEPCRCGSGRKFKKCGRPDGWEHPKPASAAPPSPSTGFSHTACYARSLEDCSATLTREHYSSKGVLNTIAGDNTVIRVSGLPFQGEESVLNLSPDALCGKILCERHNTALSAIDQTATRLAEALLELLGLEAPSVPPRRQFAGQDIEKWLLKKLVGSIAVGNLKIGEQFVPKGHLKPTPELLSLLFGDAVLLPPWGLYVRGDVHGEGTTPNKAEHGERILLEHDVVLGIMTRLHAFDFILWMDPSRRPLRSDLRPASIYRPTFVKSPLEYIELRWPGIEGVHFTESTVSRVDAPAEAGARHFPFGHPTDLNSQQASRIGSASC